MKRSHKPKITKRQKITARPKSQTAAGVVVEFRRGIKGTDNILFDGKPQVAFVGRSNAGKSSAINALLAVTVARTSRTPGKTQEINFFEVGGKGYFVDLPGYGFAKIPPADQEKIRKHILWYLTGGEAKPKLIVLILDINVGATAHDRELIQIARTQGYPILILANKIDKLSGNERPRAMNALVEEFPDIDIVPFSAMKKENVSVVRESLFQLLGVR